MVGSKMVARIALGSLLVAGWIGTARAAATPQQKCDTARITAWKLYQSCVETKLASTAKGESFDYYAAFARCRHTYFQKWAAFQLPRAGLATSTCIGARFTDNGDQTVTDNLSGLVWEKKDSLVGIHNGSNSYSWSAGAPYEENGTAFMIFLETVNGAGGFGGSNGWRLPTFAELQTIVLDFACPGVGRGPRCICPATPCVDPALDVVTTQPDYYWSSTGYVSLPNEAWSVFFSDGDVFPNDMTSNYYVRAVRGGL